jgi:hypothetical protein
MKKIFSHPLILKKTIFASLLLLCAAGFIGAQSLLSEPNALAPGNNLPNPILVVSNQEKLGSLGIKTGILPQQSNSLEVNGSTLVLADAGLPGTFLNSKVTGQTSIGGNLTVGNQNTNQNLPSVSVKGLWENTGTIKSTDTQNLAHGAVPLKEVCTTPTGKLVLCLASTTPIVPGIASVILLTDGADVTTKSLNTNTPFVLSWASLESTSCSATWTTKTTTGGTENKTTGNVAGSIIYTVICNKIGGGTVTDTVTIKVFTVTIPSPTVTLTATPTTITTGQTTKLTWTSTNATACNATAGSGFTTGGVTNNTTTGDVSNTLTTNTTFTIQCLNSAGVSVSSSVVVTVNPPVVLAQIPFIDIQSISDHYTDSIGINTATNDFDVGPRVHTRNTAFLASNIPAPRFVLSWRFTNGNGAGCVASSEYPSGTSDYSRWTTMFEPVGTSGNTLYNDAVQFNSLLNLAVPSTLPGRSLASLITIPDHDNQPPAWARYIITCTTGTQVLSDSVTTYNSYDHRGDHHYYWTITKLKP